MLAPLYGLSWVAEGGGGGPGETGDLTFCVLGFSGLFIMYTDRFADWSWKFNGPLSFFMQNYLERFPVGFLMGLCLGRWGVGGME